MFMCKYLFMYIYVFTTFIKIHIYIYTIYYIHQSHEVFKTKKSKMFNFKHFPLKLLLSGALLSGAGVCGEG